MSRPLNAVPADTVSPPAAALVGCIPSRDADARRALERLALEAHAEAGWPSAGGAFLAEAASVGAARAYVRALLTSWGVVDRAEDVALCASELATNAIQHAGVSAVGFLVAATRLGGTVRIAVLDTSHRMPTSKCPAAEDLSGRGLQLVAALADRWGYAVNVIGKTVWSEFDLAAPPPREPETPRGHPC